MNKKGQMVFVAIMVFIMVIITVVTLIEPLKDQITTARDSDHLDCDNASISVGTKATCVVTDFTLFYFVGVAIASAAAYFGIKRLSGG